MDKTISFKIIRNLKLLAFKPLEKYGKQKWHMRFGRWVHYRKMPPFWDFTEFLFPFLQWVKALLLWEKLLHIVFWLKNATDVSKKKINTALCRFFSSSAFAPTICTLLKEPVNPRLSLAYDLLSATIVHFTSINTFSSNMSSLGFLSVFRSLLYVLI